MKRNFFIIGITAVTLFTAGCETKTIDKTDISDNTITIDFAFWEPGMELELGSGLQKVADMYEELNKNVEINLISQSPNGYHEWIKARMVTNDMPDIIYDYGTELNRQYDAGYLINLEDALNSPNPYNSGEIWRDTFDDERIEQAHDYCSDTDHNIPLYGTSLAIYYNKSIYEELGLSIPETWSQFIDNCRRISENSIAPVAFMGQKRDTVHWMSWNFTSGLMEQKFLGDKNINYNGDNRLDANEMVKAIIRGDIDFENDKELQQLYISYIDKYKEFLSYCPNAADMDETAAKTMFISGGSAHYISGSWDMMGLYKNKNLDFEVGMMKFPDFEPSDSKYYGSGLKLAACQPVAVSTSVRDQKGKEEAVIDFLMFLTSDDVYKQFIDMTGNISVLRDVSSESLDSVYPNNGAPITILNFAEGRKDVMTFDSVFNDLINMKMETPTQAVFKELQNGMRMEAEDMAAKNGWNEDNDYRISELIKSGGDYNRAESE